MARTNTDLAIAMGKRMLERRKACGLTQEAVAYLSGITHRQYNKAENGKTCLSSDSLLKISKALHTSADYLLTGVNRVEKYNKIFESLETMSEDHLDLANKLIQCIAEWESDHKQYE